VFDAAGRLVSSTQNTPGVGAEQSFQYRYYGNDSMASITYPGSPGRVITSCPDEFGRPRWVSSVKSKQDCLSGSGPASNAEAYARDISYATHGAMASLVLGNGLFEQTEYNERLQPVTMRLHNGPNLMREVGQI
jgi:hypothetical protein